MRDEAAVLVELRDAIVGADAVGHVDVAGAIAGHVGRLTEARSGRAGAGRATSAAATARSTRRACACALRSSCRRLSGSTSRGLCGAHRDVFRLAAQYECDSACRVELQDLACRGVDRPDVVLRIHAQTNRGVEAVYILAEFAHELSGLVE